MGTVGGWCETPHVEDSHYTMALQHSTARAPLINISSSDGAELDDIVVTGEGASQRLKAWRQLSLLRYPIQE
ncbi:hypothetical protein P7K49_027954, partial [Saguinus oedipus]